MVAHLAAAAEDGMVRHSRAPEARYRCSRKWSRYSGARGRLTETTVCWRSAGDNTDSHGTRDRGIAPGRARVVWATGRRRRDGPYARSLICKTAEWARAMRISIGCWILGRKRGEEKVTIRSPPTRPRSKLPLPHRRRRSSTTGGSTTCGTSSTSRSVCSPKHATRSPTSGRNCATTSPPKARKSTPPNERSQPNELI